MFGIGDFQPKTTLSPLTQGTTPQAPGKAAQEQAPSIADSFSPDDGVAQSMKAGLEKLMSDERVLPGTVTKQFSDSYGRVKNLALMLSSYVGGESRTQVLNAYTQLFTKMEPDTKFTIVCEGPRDRQDIENLIKKNNIQNPERIKLLDSETGDNTVWARDCMVPMFMPGDTERTALLAQDMFHNWHGSDMAATIQLAKADPSIVLDREPRIITDGGEVMANTKESFTSMYSIGATAQKMAKLAHSDQQLKDNIFKYYENKTGKTVQPSEAESMFPYKFVPSQCPNDTHVNKFEMVKNEDYKPNIMCANTVDEGKMYEDMAIKLFEQQFGKPVTALGKDDPSTSHVESAATDHLDMGTTPVDDKTFFLGSVDLAKKLMGKMTDTDKKETEEMFKRLTGKDVSIDDIANSRNDNNELDFNGYEKTLKDKGYNVVRVPHLAPNKGGFGGPYISYNNCLMERFEKDGKEVRRVFLPVYGISTTDNFAINCFKKEGFEVIPLPLAGLSTRWGALRCISNWLDRSPRG